MIGANGLAASIQLCQQDHQAAYCRFVSRISGQQAIQGFNRAGQGASFRAQAGQIEQQAHPAASQRLAARGSPFGIQLLQQVIALVEFPGLFQHMLNLGLIPGHIDMVEQRLKHLRVHPDAAGVREHQNIAFQAQQLRGSRALDFRLKDLA